MFLQIEWGWWLVIVAVAVLAVPLKIKFMQWWGKRQKEENNSRKDKWGGEE